jgi:hypothetical protein
LALLQVPVAVGDLYLGPIDPTAWVKPTGSRPIQARAKSLCFGLYAPTESLFDYRSKPDHVVKL